MAPSTGFDMTSCALCPRNCGVNRVHQKGFCGIGHEPVVAKAFPHFGEEPCISGSRGSGTVFFSGCVLRCAFCQNHPISHGRRGQTLTVPQLADTFVRLAERGVHNLNLVTPTHQAHAIAEAFQLLEFQGRMPGLPVAWNSGGYDAEATLRLMARWVSVWMPDLKFHDPVLSERMAAAPDYFERASAAIRLMAQLVGPATYDGDGLLQRGLLVRHLVLPGHTRDSIRLLEWLAAEFGGAVPVSLMSQYTPLTIPAPGAPTRRLTRREYDKVLDALFRLGLEEGYVQERSAAGTAMIPDWDGEGLPNS
jgi:putative pyruvate formate lyase activating enzyme